jgi:hypothetical protein
MIAHAPTNRFKLCVFQVPISMCEDTLRALKLLTETCKKSRRWIMHDRLCAAGSAS